jgi:hypothetical protein
MRPSVVEVLDIGVKYAVELLLMQDEHVIQALSTHTAKIPFTDGIRSRSLIRCSENLDVTCFRSPRETHPKLAIMITDEVLRSRAIGGGLPQLLCGPSVARTSCDAHINHLPRVQEGVEEGEERTEEYVGDLQEITGPDLPGMSVKEGRPVLPTWSSRVHLSHLFLDSAFADSNTQLE